MRVAQLESESRREKEVLPPCSSHCSLLLKRCSRNDLLIALIPVACSRSASLCRVHALCKQTNLVVSYNRISQDINQFVLEAGPAIANSESTVRRIVSTTNARLDVRSRCCVPLLWHVHATAGARRSCSESRQRPQHQCRECVSQVSLFGMRCKLRLVEV